MGKKVKKKASSKPHMVDVILAAVERWEKKADRVYNNHDYSDYSPSLALEDCADEILDILNAYGHNID